MKNDERAIGKRDVLYCDEYPIQTRGEVAMSRTLNLGRDGLEIVYRAQGMLQAEAIKGRLEASGIPAALDYESIGHTLGITIDGLGEVRILVAVERADEARELLRADDADEDLIDEEDQQDFR